MGRGVLGKAKSIIINETEEFDVDQIEEFIRNAGSDHIPTFGGEFEGGIQCQQVPVEFAGCVCELLTSGEKINKYLEVGSAAGGSAFIMDHFFKPGTMVLIDNNQHPKHHVRPYILRDIPHEEIVGDSHDQGTLNALREKNLVFDAILIDGDHSYEGAFCDVNFYTPFVKPSGFIIMHDTAFLPPFGVKQVFDEMKKDDRFEFIKEFVSPTIPACGIGLFRKVANED